MPTHRRIQTARTLLEATHAFGELPFTRSQAQDAGISLGRLRAACERGLIVRLSHGVYVVACDEDADSGDLDEIRHGIVGLEDLRIAVTGRAGARLHSLPFIAPTGRNDDRHGTEILVHADDAARCGRLRTGAILRPCADWPEDIATAHGVPVTSVLHTAVDVVRMGMRPGYRLRAEALPLPETLVLLDAATRRAGAGNADEATAMLRALRPRFWHCTGIAAVDLATPHVDPHAESPLESWSRGYMIVYGVPAPLTQQIVTGADGIDYRVDFCWPGLRVIGEADGIAKYGDTPAEVHAAKRRELARQRALEAAGWIVIRWTWDELARDPYAVMRRILDALRLAA